MPKPKQIPDAVAAAEAVHDALYPEIPKGHDKMPYARALWIETYARIIAEKMLPVVEAGYKEGWWAGVDWAQSPKTTSRVIGFEKDWRGSRAFAALGQIDEVKP